MREHLPATPGDEASTDLPPDRQKPPLRAPIAVLASQRCREKVQDVAPGQFTVESFTDPSAFEAAQSGKVAVALLARDYPADRLESVVKRTISASPHARIALLGAMRPGDETVPRDAEFVPPIDRDHFVTHLKQLYIRAHYAATLERYYTVSVKIRNAELADEGAVGDEHVPRLREVRDRSRRYLRQFRAYLDEESLSALKSRTERLEALVADAKQGPDPTAHGLPDSCPECDLDWTEWHGRGLENGFQKLGANTWQCRNCGETIADASPSDYQVR